LWELANALQKTPRRLGFSVEGRVTQRMNKAGEPIVARAVVRNVAVTNCPVNNKTALEVLAKSLQAAEMSKALEAGPAPGPSSDPGSVPAGVPLSGIGAGRVLMPESMSGYTPNGAQPKKKKKKAKLAKSEALALIKRRYPGITHQTAVRIFRHAVSTAR
jgi:hypothetical protein